VTERSSILALVLSASSAASAGCGKSTAPSPAPAPLPATDEAKAAVAPSTGPSDDDGVRVSSEVAGKFGAPGFRSKGLKGQGWSRIEPRGNVFFELSGPPGGPLHFQVRAYSDAPSGASIEKLFKETDRSQSAKPGPAEKVRLAGAEREAQSFHTGAGHAAANWCVIKLPASEGASKGLLVLAEVGVNEGTPPKCEHSLRHDAIKPLVESFTLE
jgi:hypothetical protein